MERTVFVSPGAAEEMAATVHGDGFEPRTYIDQVCVLKPWPGSIEAMQVASEKRWRGAAVSHGTEEAADGTTKRGRLPAPNVFRFFGDGIRCSTPPHGVGICRERPFNIPLCESADT